MLAGSATIATLSTCRSWALLDSGAMRHQLDAG
jgi:hypothetical protein